MTGIKIVILLFSCIGAVDFLLGNKLGAGKEFEKAFSLFAPMSLSMLGMIVIAPAIGVWLMPVFEGVYRVLGIDPSIIPASLFANDMGGMQLAQTVCVTREMGDFNAFVISSMMGCVISFTIPFSLGLVAKNQQGDLFFGFLCGIVTVPLGSLVAGLMCGIAFGPLVLNLIPLIVLSLILIAALVLAPQICIKAFRVFGTGMKILALAGLMVSLFTFLTKVTLSPHFDSFENAALVCANACVTLSGALPFMLLVSKVLAKPLHWLGSKLGINGVSALAFLGSTVTNASTFGIMDRMDRKGVVLNAAFAVSASFTFGSHLAFTMAFDGSFVLPMIAAKLLSGLCALLLALLIWKE